MNINYENIRVLQCVRISISVQESGVDLSNISWKFDHIWRVGIDIELAFGIHQWWQLDIYSICSKNFPDPGMEVRSMDNLLLYICKFCTSLRTDWLNKKKKKAS